MLGNEQPVGGAFRAGSRVAGYRLEEQIGQGGMAVVFRALDERLRRQVAIKVLAPALAADESFRHRFIRESRSAAAVDDPHIIPVFEAGDADGVLFIAMRYVPGGDAGTLVRRLGPLPPARGAAIISAVASALDAAHAAGLVHRDVKPANMLMDVRPGRSDHVYLSDFGLTTGALSSVGLTGMGQFIGTLDYAAPEQIEGRQVDARTDEYALGCAAFELLSGEPPFRRDEGMAVLYAQLSAAPPCLTSRRPGLPSAVDDVLLRALSKDRRDRYAGCGEFAAALHIALGLPRLDAVDGASLPPVHPPTEVVPAAGASDARWAATGPAVPSAESAGGRALTADRGPSGGGIPDHAEAVRRKGHRRAGLMALGVVAVLAAGGGIAYAGSAGQSSGHSHPSGLAGRPSSATGQAENSTATGSPSARAGHSARPAAAGVPAIVRTFPDPGTGPRHVNSVAFSPDGQTLATGDTNGDAYVWDAGTGRLTATLPGAGGVKVFAVAFSPDGKTVAAGYANASTKVWQVTTGQLLATIRDPAGKAVDSVAFSPDGKTLATGDENGQTYLWEIPGGSDLPALASTLAGPVHSGVWAVAFSPDGTMLATADFDGSTYLWNMPDPAGTPAATFTIPGGQDATAVAFSPDGGTLATGSLHGATYLWNLGTGAHTVVSEPGSAWGVAFSKNGTLAVGHGDGSTYLRATSTGGQGTVLTDPASGSQGVGAVAFSRNGRWLATGDSNGTTYLWHLG